jgi:methanogenic corrinoid protein MtbC1
LPIVVWRNLRIGIINGQNLKIIDFSNLSQAYDVDTNEAQKMNPGNGIKSNRAPLFNIKAVVKHTGLNPATIRAWERRYGFPTPHRTAGGHRQYSQRDIDTLLWLLDRQEEGVSISHAIDLWRSHIENGEDPLLTRERTEKIKTIKVAQIEGAHIDELRQAWVSACLAFDRETAEQVLESAFARFNPETVCIQLLQKGISEVGAGWFDGGITIQQEHFTSALSVQRLEMLIAAAPPPTRQERIIVATAPQDYHVFSPLLITYLLRRRGWDVVYLGADVPIAEMETTIDQVQPSLVIISAQLLHTAAALKEIAEILQLQGVTLAFGGLVFNGLPKLQELIPGHFLGNSIDVAVKRVASLIEDPAPILEPALPLQGNKEALTQFRARRTFIESHVWSAFIATNKPTKDLTAINNEIAQTVEAALILGDISLLQNESSWIEYLLMGYRLPRDFVSDYILAYYQAANIHLGDAATTIVNWLANLVKVENQI